MRVARNHQHFLTGCIRTGVLALVTLMLAPHMPVLAQGIPGQGVQVNVNPSNQQDIIGDAANEPSTAVNPLNPDNIVVGFRYFPTINSDARYGGYAVTMDGGHTWTTVSQLAPPPGIPNAQQSDPSLAVTSSGKFYYWSEVFVPSFAIYLYPSTDGGVTWGAPFAVENPVTGGDKGWLVIDKSGGTGDGNLYGGWNNSVLGGQCFVRSTDGGQSFPPAQRIADQGGTQWMLIFDVGPDGELYAAWRNNSANRIFITKSTKAQDPNQDPVFDAYGSGGRYGLDRVIDYDNNPDFLPENPTGFHQLFLGVNHADDARRGWVYASWPDNRRDDADIAFARSSDGGLNWETGAFINDDGPGNVQWFSSMDVAPNGRIDVTWFDTRDYSGGGVPWSRLYYSFSTDGGTTWSKNVPLSYAFDTTIGWPQQQKIGDYYVINSDRRGVDIVYPATFNGGQDLWYMRVTPFQLLVSDLQAGQVGQFSVMNGTSNAPTYLVYSLAGLGSTYVPQLNVTIGLNHPAQAGGMKRTDSSGDASWSLPIPPGAGGHAAWFQVIQRENASNIVHVDIN